MSMIKQMSNEELLNIENNSVWLRFCLTQEEIKEWKANGYFKHIKTELENIPNITFGCLEQLGGSCVYCFTLPTVELMRRFDKVIVELFEGRKKHLIQVSNKRGYYFPSGDFSGIPKLCNLF